NRDPEDPSLILAVSDGVPIPGNATVSAAERRRRIRLYHAPYHARVDRAVARATGRARRSVRAAQDTGPAVVSSARRPAEVRILALHSFTPVLAGAARRLDIGVLYDRHPELARALGRRLQDEGYRVGYNQPYSGLAGLIYSARRHGSAYG